MKNWAAKKQHSINKSRGGFREEVLWVLKHPLLQNFKGRKLLETVAHVGLVTFLPMYGE